MRGFASAVAVVLAFAGCAEVARDDTQAAAKPPIAAAREPAAVAKREPSRPPPKEAVKEIAQPPSEPLPSKGTQLLMQAAKSYDDGDYRSASIQLQASLRETLTGAEQASAHKYLAFVACASKRAAACRDEFRKALAADPTFDLTPAEAGHPSWGPAFKRVKAEAAASAKRKRTP